MKRLTIILVAIAFVTLTNAQEFSSFKNKKLNLEKFSKQKTYKKVRDMIWVQDSFKRFDYNSSLSEWDATYREKVIERYPNGYMKINESANYTLGEWTNEHKFEYAYDYSYESPFGIIFDELLLNVWNTNTLNWQVDTGVYHNLT